MDFYGIMSGVLNVLFFAGVPCSCLPRRLVGIELERKGDSGRSDEYDHSLHYTEIPLAPHVAQYIQIRRCWSRNIPEGI